MKSNFIYVIALVIMIGCKTKPDFETAIERVKVGMSYDEVERLLGKPHSIVRGATQLTNDETEDSEYNFAGYQTDKQANIDSFMQRGVWVSRKKIQKVGDLIYVTWEYPKVRLDTNFTIYFYTKPETSYYYSSDHYMKLGYLEEKWITEDQYKIIKEGSLRNRVSVYKTEPKRKRYVSWKLAGIYRNYYQVHSQYSVIFDAASGRVVESHYLPFRIEQMKPN